jgi:hypothetical protein
MKNFRSLWLMVILVGLILPGNPPQAASAIGCEQFQVDKQLMSEPPAAQTPVPTLSTSPPVTETPEPRLLPPVGANAGLVLGASVLVLIVLGGVMLISRRRPKH